MKLIIAQNGAAVGQKAAEYLAAQVMIKSDAVLGLATGSTFLEVYKAAHKISGLNLSQVKTVNLDEYVGLSAGDTNSYSYYMNTNFFNHTNIDKQNTYLPNGMAANTDVECENYDSLIDRLGGIDLQFLGLGVNGHIGFNEPGEYFIANTHCVRLTDSTREANARLFGRIDNVPRYAITMGIRTILQAKKIILCVCGKHKTDALRKVMFEKITPRVPASILQLHNDVTVIADKEAFDRLKD